MEVSDELVWRVEGIGAFLPAKMTAIAFTDLVVVTHDTYAVDDVGHPVLEPVRRARDGFPDLPQDQLGECGVREGVPKLRSLGYDVTYREYDGRHQLPPDIARQAFEWFTST